MKKGFTLIELVIVIVIIGVLCAIAIPNFISFNNRIKHSCTKITLYQDGKTIKEMYVRGVVNHGETCVSIGSSTFCGTLAIEKVAEDQCSMAERQ